MALLGLLHSRLTPLLHHCLQPDLQSHEHSTIQNQSHASENGGSQKSGGKPPPPQQPQSILKRATVVNKTALCNKTNSAKSTHIKSYLFMMYFPVVFEQSFMQ